MKYITYLLFFIFFFTGITQSPAQEDSFSLPGHAYAVSKDFRTLFVADLFDKRVRAVSFTSKKDVAHFRHDFLPFAVFTDDEDALVITVDQKEIKIWDAYSFELKKSVEWNKKHSVFSLWKLDYNEQSNLLALTDSYNNLFIVNIKTSEVKNARLNNFQPISHISMNRTGRHVFAISGNRKIIRWNTDLNTEPQIVAKPKDKPKVLTGGQDHLFVLSSENQYNNNEATILKYDLNGNLVSEKKLADFYSLTTGFGVYNTFNIDFSPSLYALNDQVVFIEATDGLFYIDLSSGYRRKILKQSWQKTFMPKSYKIKQGWIAMNIDKSVLLLDTWGQIKDKISIDRYNDGIFGSSQPKNNYFLNSQKYLMQIDSSGKLIKDSAMHKPTGIYTQSDDQILFATTGNTIEIWDINTFKRTNTIELTRNAFPASMNSLKNELYIAYPNSGTIEMFDMKSGKRKKTYSVTEKHITDIIVSGEILITSTTDGHLIKYHLNKKETIDKQQYLFDGISRIEKNKDFLVAAGNGRFIVIPENDSTFVLSGHERNINLLDLTRFDNRTFALTGSTGDSTVRIWDIENKVLLKNIDLKDISSVSYSNFLDHLNIISSGDFKFELTDNEALAQTIKGVPITTKFQTSNTGQEFNIKFSPGQKYILMIGTNNVKIWDVLSSQLLSTINIKMDNINDAEILGDERTLVVTDASSLQYYDIYTGLLKKTISHKTAGIMSMHMLRHVPNTNYMLGVNKHGWHLPFLFHTNSGRLQGALPIGNYQNIYDIQFSPDGKLMAVYSDKSTDVLKWDNDLFSGKGNVILEIPYKKGEKIFHSAKKIAFSRDSRYIAAMFFEDETPVTRVYDIENKTKLSEFFGGVADFGYNNRLIQSSATQTHHIEFKDIHKDTSLKTLRSNTRHIDIIKSILYSHKYDRFISVDRWGNYKFWDGITGAPVKESNRFDNDFYSVLPANNGRTIFFNHKRGVYAINLDNLNTTHIRNAKNYPFNVAYNDQTGDLYYISNQSAHNQGFIESYNVNSDNVQLLFTLPVNHQDIGNMNLSADKQYLGFKMKEEDQEKIYVYDLLNKSHMEIDLKEEEGFAGFDPKENHLLVLTQSSSKLNNDTRKIEINRELFHYNLLRGKKTEKFLEYSFSERQEFFNPSVVERMGFLSEKISPMRNYITTLSQSRLNVLTLPGNEIIYQSWDDEDMASIQFDQKEEKLFILYENGDLKYIDLKEKKEYAIENIGLTGTLKQLSDDWLLILGNNDELMIYDWSKKQKLSSLYVHEGKDIAVITKDNNYYASPDAIKNLNFRTLTNVYSFEQFDLFYNKPHEVLEALNSSDHELQSAYKKAWEKRLSISGFQELNLSSTSIPELSIDKSNIPINTRSEKINLNVDLSGNESRIIQLNAWSNNVPLHGKEGIEIDNEKNKEIEIPLSRGNNKIELSCVNEKGVESLKETFEIYYETEKDDPSDLYLIAISTSLYEDQEMNLRYAVKDGRDLVNTYLEHSSRQWDKIVVDTLFNEEADRENILELKDKLLNTGINDQVILFVSGHGLLDQNYDFWFATHDMDFSDPARNGVSYDQLEWLLDSIPARKKLFMMDACHSGEVDKEAMRESKGEFQLATAGDIDGKVSGQQFKGATAVNQPKLGLQNSFELMQELFTDLNRGSGAQVISAAAGNSYALESGKWNNGVFTYAVLNGLKDYKADANGDKEITISELKKYVSKRVLELTDGAQKPTTRQENVEFDFRVW